MLLVIGANHRAATFTLDLAMDTDHPAAGGAIAQAGRALSAKFTLAEITVKGILIAHEMAIRAEVEAGEWMVTNLTERLFQQRQERVPNNGVRALVIAVFDQNGQRQPLENQVAGR